MAYAHPRLHALALMEPTGYFTLGVCTVMAKVYGRRCISPEEGADDQKKGLRELFR